MNNIKSINKVCLNLLRKSFGTPRLYVAFLWMSFLLYGFAEKFRIFSNMTGVPVAPWILPFFTKGSGCQIFIILGAALTFCDAPFLTSSAYLQLIRSGRKNWFFGTMLYIVCLSFVYTMGIALLSVLFLLPKATFIPGWGKIIGTLAQTDAGAQISLTPLNYDMIKLFKPLLAEGLTIAVVWLNCIVTGMLIYMFNFCVKQGAGLVAAAVMALSPQLILLLVQEKIAYYLAPPAWMYILYYDWTNNGYYPSIGFVYGVLFLIIILCGGIIYYRFQKADLNETDEI